MGPAELEVVMEGGAEEESAAPETVGADLEDHAQGFNDKDPPDEDEDQFLPDRNGHGAEHRTQGQ